MRRWDFAGGEIRNGLTHSFGEVWREDVVSKCVDEERRLLDALTLFGRQISLVLEIDLACTVPVTRPVNAVLHVLGDVVIKFLSNLD